jgi:hypothetical protein
MLSPLKEMVVAQFGLKNRLYSWINMILLTVSEAM